MFALSHVFIVSLMTHCLSNQSRILLQLAQHSVQMDYACDL